MTRILRKAQLLALILSATSAQFVSAAVIENDAMIVTPTTAPPDIEIVNLPFDHQFILTQTAVPGDGLFLLQVEFTSSSTFLFRYAGIAEVYSLFIVEQGTIFDATYVNSQASFVTNLNTPGENTLTLQPGESQYIAYWDDRTIPGTPGLSPSDDDLYGWSLVTNVAGELVVTESATATSSGIIVGTLQQIPEPSGSLLLIATISMAMARRRRA
ncbi:PEP-CTERM sorting domain-containing protein [Luteolibacter pohnpeiensis]|uniref:PEP-CTERM sorting domain-containing protein n=1 Tax=Luteolibacter pohnpeiensis TaxID=454153 RepID=A0A934S5V4_9BACT|nr:PEP-CTERM sorting domain-containing protein [Luteolibacter pohnpeiensis]MBK1881326.1 PEP-CTERM sorting domain-containing protein [Luteolibacter pohnpeiensis]